MNITCISAKGNNNIELLMHFGWMIMIVCFNNYNYYDEDCIDNSCIEFFFAQTNMKLNKSCPTGHKILGIAFTIILKNAFGIEILET